jgi:hypothetical protein
MRGADCDFEVVDDQWTEVIRPIQLARGRAAFEAWRREKRPRGTTTPRIMWVIYHDTVYPPASRHGPAPLPDISPGAVVHGLTLVDDETLSLGGNFAC